MKKQGNHITEIKEFGDVENELFRIHHTKVKKTLPKMEF